MRRLCAWYVTGPLGHLVAGVSDLAPMAARYWWSRLRAQRHASRPRGGG